MAFLIFAAICACLYFLFFLLMMLKVFWHISGKRSEFSRMAASRRVAYEVVYLSVNVIYQYYFRLLCVYWYIRCMCMHAVPKKSRVLLGHILNLSKHTVSFAFFYFFREHFIDLNSCWRSRSFVRHWLSPFLLRPTWMKLTGSSEERKTIEVSSKFTWCGTIIFSPRSNHWNLFSFIS